MSILPNAARSSRCVVAALLLVAAPLGTVAAQNTATSAERARWTRLSASATIIRDAYGIPHVWAPTDAGAIYAFAYAQAEDNFARIEDNFIRALGRASEVYGEATLWEDRLNRALELPRLARAEYRRMDAHTRALVDAYADGVNHFLATHPEVRPRLLSHIEPWYPLVFIRYNYFQNGFARAAGLSRTELSAPPTWDDRFRQHTGSNGWVIGPSRSASGHALLFINPHLPFFGPGQVYEGHLRSGEGWNFTGYTRFGFPFPYVGHGERLGWVSTDNAADHADVYRETFDDPAHPLAYRYGSGHRLARAWTDTIRVRNADGTIRSQIVELRATHHGPILAVRDGRPLALRMAKLDGDGWLAEWYAMTRARSVAELQRAMRPLAMMFGNVMAADADGHTWYMYNGAIPRRDPRFDWTQPLDGSDPAMEWKGYHSMSELPQLADPPSGWMENCNSSPFRMTDRGNVDERRFPAYMVPEGTEQGMRSQASHRLLRDASRLTLDDLARLGFDRHVLPADSLLPRLVASLAAADDAQRARLAPAIDLLRAWDREATTESAAMTLFNAWREQLPEFGYAPTDGAAQLQALAKAIDTLTARHGTWQIPWGEVSRLQRPDERASPNGAPAFRDDAPSIAVAGVPDGAAFTVYPEVQPGLRRRYGVAGGSYVSVVEFGPPTRALAVHTFGASGDPDSPHYFDQAPLYARGEMRPVALTADEVERAAVRRYHPGER